jgi:hypothetical protein
MGVNHLSKLWATFPSAAAPKPLPRRQILPNDGKSFRSVVTQQSQITVPNFVPCVPKFVPYFDVSVYHLIAFERIFRGCRDSFCPKGFRDRERYEMISDRIGEF